MTGNENVNLGWSWYPSTDEPHMETMPLFDKGEEIVFNTKNPSQSIIWRNWYTMIGYVDDLRVDDEMDKRRNDNAKLYDININKGGKQRRISSMIPHACIDIK
jgi:hypothetical protein